MPIFPLASWELPPDCDETLEAPAISVHISAQEVEFWIRQIKTPRGNRVFFREAHSEEVGNWVWPAHLGHFDVSNIESEFEQHRLRDFARFFCFEGAPFGCAGLQELIVGPSLGYWPAKPFCPSFEHSRYGLPGFFYLKAAQVGRLAKGWLHDDYSTTRIAFDWIHSSPLEQQSRVLSLRPEVLSHLKTLFLHVLRTEKWEEEGGAPDITWSISEREYELNGESYEKSYLSIGEWGGEVIEVSPRLAAWKEALWAHFDVSLERGAYELMPFDFPEIRQHSQLEIKTHSPTAHEILESHLALREWVQSIGSPLYFQQLLALDEE